MHPLPPPASPSRQRGLGVIPSSARRSVTGEERGAFPPCAVSCPPTGQHLTPPHQWTAGDGREQSTALGSPHCGGSAAVGCPRGVGCHESSPEELGLMGACFNDPRRVGGGEAGMGMSWVQGGPRLGVAKEAPPISGQPTAKGPAWICPPALQSQDLGFSPSGTPALSCTSVLLGFRGQDCGRCAPCQACMERPGLSPAPPPSLSPGLQGPKTPRAAPFP